MSTDDTRFIIQKRLSGMDSYAIVTDRATAEAAGWLNLMRDVRTALGPFFETNQASSMFMGVFSTPDKKLAGIHFCAKPMAAKAVLKAFPGYKLVDRNGNEIPVEAERRLKKASGPRA